MSAKRLTAGQFEAVLISSLASGKGEYHYVNRQTMERIVATIEAGGFATPAPLADADILEWLDGDDLGRTEFCAADLDAAKKVASRGQIGFGPRLGGWAVDARGWQTLYPANTRALARVLAILAYGEANGVDVSHLIDAAALLAEKRP